MAKQIIFLDVLPMASDSFLVKYIFWITTKLGTAPNDQFQSAYKQATDDEIAVIRKGAVIEETYTESYAISTSLDNIKLDLITKYQARTNYLNSIPASWQFYGITFDGSKWSA